MINVIARVVAREYWENVADNLSKAGWSWGRVSAVDSKGRTIWIADAHRDDGKRPLNCDARTCTYAADRYDTRKTLV